MVYSLWFMEDSVETNWSRELNTALPFYAFGRDFDLQNEKWLRMWSPRIDMQKNISDRIATLSAL